MDSKKFPDARRDLEDAWEAESGPVLRGEGIKSADEKYRALVSVDSRYEMNMQFTEELSHYCAEGMISEVEGRIFGIEAADIPALYWAYERYENLIDFSDMVFDEYAEQERKDHARFFLGKWVWSFDMAVGFMSEVCGLPDLKCMGWVSKIVAADVRGGRHGKAPAFQERPSRLRWR